MTIRQNTPLQDTTTISWTFWKNNLTFPKKATTWKEYFQTLKIIWYIFLEETHLFKWRRRALKAESKVAASIPGLEQFVEDTGPRLTSAVSKGFRPKDAIQNLKALALEEHSKETHEKVKKLLTEVEEALTKKKI